MSQVDFGEMTGVRVTALYYKLDLRPETAYRADAQGSVQLVGFNGELRPEQCAFVPTEHFGSVEEARARLQPQLQAWRTWLVLTTGQDWLPFIFDGAEREPWPPPKPGDAVVMAVEAADEFRFSGQTATLTLTRATFPDAPPPFRVDECASVGFRLLEDAQRMPQHVLKFASTFASLLESEHGPSGEGRRKSATAALNLSGDLLGDLSKICTHGGMGAEARAFKHGSGLRDPRIELTPERTAWVFRVFGELVKRQGQYAAGAVPLEKYSDPMP